MNGYEWVLQHNFAGRTIAVTGGAGALGSVVAEALAWAGANVAVLDRSVEAGERLVQRIGGSGAAGRALFIPTDVLQRDSLAAAEARIRAELGPVDAVVNSAGGNHPAATTGAYAAGSAPAPSFFDLTEAGVRAVFDLNFLGTFLPCQVFGRGMVERGTGSSSTLPLSFRSGRSPGFRPTQQPRQPSPVSRNGWPSTWRKTTLRASGSTRWRRASSCPNRAAFWRSILKQAG